MSRARRRLLLGLPQRHTVPAIGTGLRQGELLALRWSDVDLESGRLTVRHTLQRGTRELAEPKTERGR